MSDETPTPLFLNELFGGIKMAGLIGQMTQFDSSEESWSSYVERLEIFMDANDIKEEKKVSVLLTVIGTKNFNLVKNLCAPSKPTEKKYDELVKLVEEHLSPKPSFIAERYKFSLRNQQEHESIAEYIVQLKQLSMFCEFKSSLADYLRDRLVSGLRSDAIKKRLLGEDDLTFEKAATIATNMEMMDKGAAQLTGGSSRGLQIAHLHSGGRKGSAPRQGEKSHPQHQHRPQHQGQPPSTTFRREESNVKCYVCAKPGHKASVCRFRAYKCRKCGVVGHLAQACRSNLQERGKSNSNSYSRNKKFTKQNYVDVNVVGTASNVNPNGEEHLPEMYDLNIFALNKSEDDNFSIDRVKPILVDLKVENKSVNFEVDSGACVSVINEQCYENLFKSKELKQTNLVLSSYTNQPIKPLGKLSVRVQYQNVEKQLTLYVVTKGANPLMGRDWIRDLGVTVQIPREDNVKSNVNQCTVQNVESKVVNDLYEKFPEVFTDSLGCYKGEPARLELKPNVVPKFLKPRPIPFALKSKVEAEIDRLVMEGILSPINNSEWGSPVVPVIKKSGELRLCADFRASSLNDALIINRHPIPRIEDLFNTLQKGSTFSKIDLSQAYQQVSLDEQSKKYCTISTTKGLFMYNRVPYGVASAPGIYQKIMESILTGIPGVVCFLDDILITGENVKVHRDRLYEVCRRLSENGLTVSKNKCEFFRESIEYLGYVVSKEGLSTSPSKISAIENAPTPTNVTQLKAFLGMVNYYGKYVTNLSTIATPLYNLLRKDSVFEWSLPCQQAFQIIKSKLGSAPILAHYDPNLPVILATDSSCYGLGAVLSQIQKDGSERPIGYASRTLSKSEVGYSVVDKEALGIVYGVKKFNQYVYGRKFTLVTDHKPLLSIFGPKKGLPAYAASRLQRYALFLTNYDFDIKYVKSQANANADCLSRLPLNVKEFQCEVDDVNYVGTYLQYIKENDIPVDFNKVKQETKKDSLLNRVYGYLLYGWPNGNVNIDNDLKPFFQRQSELAIENGILLWGHRIVVPHSLRKLLLAELHCGHLGIVKMKAMARSYFWWPGLDADIENVTNSCSLCLMERQNPAKCKLHVWEFPKNVWERLHIDHFGPIQNKMYLVIVDAHSKWLEVEKVSSTSAKETISKLRPLFARFGLPNQIVSDNGSPYTSYEFKEFLKSNGIKHTLTPPYHPATNGLAENSVKTAKKRVKLAIMNSENVDLALCKFLLAYRTSVHSTTNETPASLMFNRPLRTMLDLIRPNLSNVVHSKQTKQMSNYGGSKTRVLVEGQTVLVRDYRARGSKWTEGVILKVISAVSYLVKLENDVICKRHIDQLIGLNSSIIAPRSFVDRSADQVVMAEIDKGRQSAVSNSPRSPSTPVRGSPKINTPRTPSDFRIPTTDGYDVTTPMPRHLTADSPKQSAVITERRYPIRDRKPVEKLNL